MPKIVIREIDNTEAGSAEYANFAVVVPGFVKAETTNFSPDLSVFDENGVYECKDKEVFKTKIGLRSAENSVITPASAPEWHTEWVDGPCALTEAEFTQYMSKGTLCVVTANDNDVPKIGKLEDLQYKYDIASEEFKSSYEFKDPAPAVTPDPETPDPENPDPETSDPEEPTEPVTVEEALPESSYTQFILLSSIGNDEITGEHYGNQIAFELLNLGYTVLYKKLDSITDLTDSTFWTPLKDKSIYDFRYIISGLLEGNTEVYQHMIGVAEFATAEDTKSTPFDNVGTTSHGRGDCIALLDIDTAAYVSESPKSHEEIIASVSAYTKEYVTSSKYAAAFLPVVNYTASSLHERASFGNNTAFPASFHYLACAARSAEHYNEWYANAGYTRGISNYTIDSVGYKFGETAVNMFQKRASDPDNNVLKAINPIISLRGSYYMWGNRTTFNLGAAGTPQGDLKASHFLNIRQLCSTIKKKVYITCRQLTFDPNSDILWVNFCNSIRPLLEKMKADQGIADYTISKVKTTRKAFLAVNIRIVPIEAVEDFDISIYLEDSLAGVVATTEE